MSTPVLITKLYAPPIRPRIVTRPRLVEQLNQGLHGKLTLICAPAGFGKTSLASQWITGNDWPTAWLSLDEGDSDPAVFMAYLMAALRTVAPEIGATAIGAPQLSPLLPAESTLTALLNDISALHRPIVLVLDDYHLIESGPVNEAVAFLIEHMPPQMHLVITSRADPPLPLARLRARGQMTELRASDLRFTPEEATAFMNDVMNLNLSEQDVATLDIRTEGWIAGLQLAALSIHGHHDQLGFIEAFAGNDRYIVDYLAEEVLQRQPQHLRDFLLQTSLLDRLSGPLCDAVTGRNDSRTILDSLERNNLFVVPLDEKRHWYRFHHLFAEVLRAYLADEYAEWVSTLHLRASEWFQHHDMMHEAVRHTLAAEDFARAADLIATLVPEMSKTRQEVTLLGWLRALPDDVIGVRPILSVDYAGTILQTGGDLDSVEARLRDAERWLPSATGATPPSEGLVIDNGDSFRHLPGQIAIYRAGQALVRGDVAGTMRHAGQAIDLLPDHDDFRRGAAAGLLGLASWTIGDLEAGHRLYTECLARLLRAGFVSDTFGCALVLADIRLTQGRLHDAMATYERALQVASEYGAPGLRGVADIHVGMSGLYRERNDLTAAISHLETSKGMGDHSGLPQNPYRWCVAMARLCETRGDLDGAIDLLQEAQRLYVGDFSPNVRPIPAMMARVWVVGGKMAEALEWVRERGLTAQDDLSYLHEYEHITLTRVLIAQDGNSIEAAMGLLHRLLRAAESGGRMGSVIEILMLQARAFATRGDTGQALVPLERALSLAEPEGYIRLFLDEGIPMVDLLIEMNVRGILPGFTDTLLAASRLGEPTSGNDNASSAALPLDDPLSQRELEVMRLISEGLSNKEIGERLFLALDTVKGHNRKIFRKLGGQSRTEAIAKAREIGIL